MHTPEGDDDPRYAAALESAEELMAAFPDLEPTSALKQGAYENGIEPGEEQGAFVAWANARRGI